ncbi:MAG: hypothetical protein K2H36_03150, partial [Clostridia bacterium]|nr:hypothetical protein [Clostridia bacterium]
IDGVKKYISNEYIGINSFTSDTSSIDSDSGRPQLSVLIRTNKDNKVDCDKANRDNSNQVKNKKNIISRRIENIHRTIEENTSEFVDYLFDDSLPKNINISISLKSRDFKVRVALRNIFKGNYLYCFPIFRSFFRGLVRLMQEGRHHNIKLLLESKPICLNNEFTKFRFDIADVDIETIKKDTD